MTASLAALAAAACLAVLWTSLGHRILWVLRIHLQNEVECLLCAAGLGVVAYEAVVAVAEFAIPVRIAVIIPLLVTVFVASFEIQTVGQLLSIVFRKIRSGTRQERALLGVRFGISPDSANVLADRGF